VYELVSVKQDASWTGTEREFVNGWECSSGLGADKIKIEFVSGVVYVLVNVKQDASWRGTEREFVNGWECSSGLGPDKVKIEFVSGVVYELVSVSRMLINRGLNVSLWMGEIVAVG
jgi:hypothetical protein